MQNHPDKKQSGGLFYGFKKLLRGIKKIDADFLNAIEEQLLIADVGINATTKIIEQLRDTIKHDHTDDQHLRQTLAGIMRNILTTAPPTPKTTPKVILLTGVNGAGKTTVAGKLAHHFIAQGHRTMLVACDTFRAAAVEQLQVWGAKNQVPVIAQTQGADPSAVVYDALQSAAKNNIDILIADTAGRLHTRDNLMEQLKKIHRTIGKFDATVNIENMLVLDGTTGQNALSQTKLFNEAIGINGIILTKLDGTAKGGIVFALSFEFDIPVCFISNGEKISDLHIFDPDIFVKSIL